MSLPEPSLSVDDPRILEAARAYLAELETGFVPSRSEYFEKHPDLVEELADCFDGIDLAHAAAKALRPPESVPVRPEQDVESLGDFTIIREIGRGGMGIVYEAVQLSLGRRVALKVLPFAAALDAKQLQRFRTEAHAAAQLHHTNIVPVYAVGCERGVHYYAMQIIDGRSLDSVIRDLRGDGPCDIGSVPTLDLRQRETVKTGASSLNSKRSDRSRDHFRSLTSLIAQVADALDYAHDAGVIHRDIKPANLLLDAKGTIWITDFGLAHVVADSGLTQTGDVFGTLRYMSPEQASGRRSETDHRTDVYSLGATFYELLTLRPIFPGNDRPSLFHQVLTEEPIAPRSVDRAIPVELETIVLKAIAKSPADRYSTAREMAADLRRFLEERPILARRPSLVDRARKWKRRHPGVVAAAFVLLALSAIGLAITTALIAREEARTKDAYLREKQHAVEAEQRFLLARRLADEMIRIADQESSNRPEEQSFRRLVLTATLAYYQEFIALRRGDPNAQAELELTRARIESILADLAVMQAAEQHMLLKEPGVQFDLKLSLDQRNRLAALFKRVREQTPKPYELIGKHRDERTRVLLREMKAHETGIAEILTAAQIVRLGQLALQARGCRAFLEPDVIASLDLSSEQRDLFRSFDFGPSGGHAGNDSDPGHWLQMAETILSPQQMESWKKMIGPAYAGSIKKLQRKGGGPPGFDGPKKKNMEE